MSGGYFDYKQYVLEDIADQIECEVENRSVQRTNEWNDIMEPYPEDILLLMKETSKKLQELVPIITAIDYLIEGDYGIESFRNKIKSLENK